MSVALQLRDVRARYGASQVLFGVSLDIAPGQVLALMGRNGMGKTTTIKTICGMLSHEGEIQLDGRALNNMPSHHIARMGVGLVPEGRRCFADLTVEENLLAAARPGDWTLKSVGALFPRLAERHSQRAANLSGGEQQMLAIGRALMTNPRLLILDEATEGLAPIVRQEIWAAIARLKAEGGLSILIVDKSLRELAQIADAGVILEKGTSVWSGGFSDLSDEIADRHLGV